MSLSLAVMGLLAAGLILLRDDDSRQRASFNPPTPAPLITTPVPTRTPIPLIGTGVPRMQLINFNHELVTLRGFSGKILILNFWASWCIPCRTEMPALAEFARQNEDSVVVLAVTDPEDGQTPEDVREFMYEYSQGELKIALDEGSLMADYFLVETLPMTYVIDGDGIIRFRHVGEITEPDLADYISRLQAFTHEHNPE